MKTTILRFSLFSLFIIGTICAQVPRTMLVEHFTQASCGPCAAQNPALHTLLTANPNVTYIKYQVSWPGVDPMNVHNPSQVNSRVNYYTVSSVPSTVFEGNVYKGSPSGFTQSMINARASASSPFSLSITARINDTQDSIFATAIVRKEADTATTGVFTRIAVLEKHIHFNIAPGSNGEKDFYHVMKRMLPNAVGTALPTTMAVGDYDTIEVAWKIVNVYEIDQLMVVGFIQNTNSKNVYQAASSDAMFTSVQANLPDFKVMVYPNPTNDILNFSYPSSESVQIQLFNNQGQIIHTETSSGISDSYSTDVSAFVPGIYLCKIIAGDNEHVSRVLIQAQ
jgi:hypothetical protein